MDNYLVRLSKFYGDDYKKIINFSQRLKLTSEEKIVIAAPVHSSEKTVRILKAYNHQKLDYRFFRIVLFLNRHKHDENFKDLESEIKRFQKKSNIRVSFFKKTFNTKPKIGLIRKILIDTILLASKNPKLIIVSNDCDTLTVSDNYLNEIYSGFKKNNKQIMYRNFFRDYPVWAGNCNIFLLLIKFYGLFEKEYNKLPIPFSFRVNTDSLAFTAQMYAEIGGFASERAVAEDLQFGSMAGSLYGKKIFKEHKEVIVSSYRRLMETYISSVPFYAGWANFGEDHFLRDSDENKMAAKLKRLDKKTTLYYFEKEISLCFNYSLKRRILPALRNNEKIGNFEAEALMNKKAVLICSSLFKKALDSLGFSFKMYKYPIGDYIVSIKRK